MAGARRTLVAAALCSAAVAFVALPDGLEGSVSAAEEATLSVSSAGAATAIEVATVKLPMVGTEPLKAWVGRASGALDDPKAQNDGFASVLFPTDVAAAPQGLFNLLGFPVVGDLVPGDHPVMQAYGAVPGLIPPWPLAARGSYPGDPGGRRNVLRSLTAVIPGAVPISVAGLVQAVDVGRAFASATAEASEVSVSLPFALVGDEFSRVVEQAARLLGPAAGTPSLDGYLVKAEGVTVHYRAAKEGVSASSEVVTDIGGVQLLGGLIELTGMRAAVRHAVGEEGPVDVQYAYRVAGTRVLGVAVELTGDGLTVVDQRVPAEQVAPVQEALVRVLAAAPVRVRLPEQRVVGTAVDTTLLAVEVPGSDLRLSFGLAQSRFAAQRAVGGVAEPVSVAPATEGGPLVAVGMLGAGGGGAESGDLLAGERPGPAGVGAAAPLSVPGPGREGVSPGEAAQPAAVDERLVAVGTQLDHFMDRVAILVALGALVSVLAWRARRGVLLSLRP